MIEQELSTFFPTPKRYTFGEVSFFIGEYTFEEYLYFLNFIEKKEQNIQEIKIFLRGILGDKDIGMSMKDFELYIEKNSGIEVLILDQLLKGFEDQKKENEKKDKKSGRILSIIRQMTFLMMRMSLSEKEILTMPYKRFFMYLDSLGYWLREETEEGREKNKTSDAMDKYGGKKATTKDYYESREEFKKKIALKK